MERRAVERILAAAPVVSPLGIAFAGPLAIEGTVAWASHRNAGMQFATPLPRETVESIVEACSANSLPPEPDVGEELLAAPSYRPAQSAAFGLPLLALSVPAGATVPDATLQTAIALHDLACALIVIACAWVLVAS